MSKILTSLGLMSGTSLDGIDVALLRTDGETQVEQGPSRTFVYSESQRALLRKCIAEAIGLTDRKTRTVRLAEAEKELTNWHAEAVHAFLKETGTSDSNIDIIGFHGQTVLHRPELRLTLQLGDGPALAKQTGIKFAYDLRAADVAAGGQGAPLVPAYHRAIAAKMSDRPLAFINIGGVANITWIGRDGQLVAFDTGPGNALLNDWCEDHGAGPMDAGGTLAANGKADEHRIANALKHYFFTQSAPKSLDRNSFNTEWVRGLNSADGARTLTAFTAAAIARSLDLLPQQPLICVICGGGRHNPVMMAEIRNRLPGIQILSAEDLHLNGDSMEAEAWAYLAVRALRGLPISFPGTTGVATELTGGLIALP